MIAKHSVISILSLYQGIFNIEIYRDNRLRKTEIVWQNKIAILSNGMWVSYSVCLMK